MKRWIVVLCLVVGISSMCACEKVEQGKRGKDISYSMVSQKDVPKELSALITKQKQNPFQLSFLDEGYLYIAVGYGEQETGGYSIQVDSVYEEGAKIAFTSHLVGPKEEDNVKEKASFPYIVVKVERVDKEVLYY